MDNGKECSHHHWYCLTAYLLNWASFTYTNFCLRKLYFCVLVPARIVSKVILEMKVTRGATREWWKFSFSEQECGAVEKFQSDEVRIETAPMIKSPIKRLLRDGAKRLKAFRLGPRSLLWLYACRNGRMGERESDVRAERGVERQTDFG